MDKKDIDYSLYDENRVKYVARISEREANNCNNYPAVYMRKLNELKKSGQAPAGQMALSVCDEDQNQNDDVSEWIPEVCTKKVAKKRDAMTKFTTDFLNECRFWQAELRQRVVPEDVYVAIETNLKSLGHHDKVNLRAKMKGLKSSFANAQKGKLGGTQWQHFNVMKFIFQDPIGEDDVAGASLASYSTYLREIPANLLHSSPKGAESVGDCQQENGDTLDLSEHVHQRQGEHEELEHQVSDLEDTLVLHPSHLLTDMEWPEGCFVVNDSNDLELLLEASNNGHDKNESTKGATNHGHGDVNRCDKPSRPDATYVLREREFAEGTFVLHDNHELELTTNRGHGAKKCANDLFKKVITAANNLHYENLAADDYGHTQNGDENNNNDTPVLNRRTSQLTIDTAANNRSPSKKSLKTGNGGKFSAPRTPPTTPSRKKNVAQSALVLSQEATNAFVKELLKRKENIVKDIIPLSVWKEIACQLVEEGQTAVTWEICREKYSVMNKFFRKIIPSNGILGCDKWRHYDCFMKIHSSDDGETERKLLWVPKRVKALIALYKEKLRRFQRLDSCETDTALYAEIAAEINEFAIDEKIVSGKQCKDEMGRLQQRYKEETDGEKWSGESPSDWPYLDDMAGILGGTATIGAPFLASAGLTTEYKVRGQDLKDISRNSRTRPNNPAVSTVAANRKPPKPLKKLYATERLNQQQQASKQQEDKVAEEIRLSRESQELRHRERMDMMKSFVNVLEKKL